jgi:citrate synthase
VAPRSELCSVERTSVRIRGRDLCNELMGHKSFTAFFYLLLVGEDPNDDQVVLVDACLAAIAEHGLMPSALASRMTLVTAPEAIQGAVAAGLLGCGTVAVGTAEEAARLLARGVKEASSGDYAASAEKLVTEYRTSGRKLPGFGHPIHHPADPRAERLLQLAQERGTAREHVKFVRALAEAANKVFQRQLVLNVSAAIPAVLLDVDFPVDAMKAVPLLARTAGLLAHIREEMQRPMSLQFAATVDQF